MTQYFPRIDKIAFAGNDSKNPLSFKYYDKTAMINGKTMADHFRFTVCYWHTFRGQGGDPFGPGTRDFAWLKNKDPMQQAHDAMDAAFEFKTKLGVDYWAFHDRDIAPEGDSIADSAAKLNVLVDYAKQKQDETGIHLLWGTANLFSHPRFAHGAATNPDFDVVCYAAAQVKGALDATVKLGGANYVFWGGREGYDTLLNTDMTQEGNNFAQFLRMSRDYAREIGFTGQLLIEPKPMEPTKHQYDFDSATTLGFLLKHGLQDDFKLNIESNHATLAGHSACHDLQVAANAGKLGSIDANRGDPQNGWDTDQFPTDLYEATQIMLILLKQGGIGDGGVNFDAKVRRGSTDLADLFYGHIGGMDTFSRGLVAADKIIKDGVFAKMVNKRYASFASKDGKAFSEGNLSLTDLVKLGIDSGEPKQISGQQELYEIIVNDYLK
jgi:xylose isomerase